MIIAGHPICFRYCLSTSSTVHLDDKPERMIWRTCSNSAQIEGLGISVLRSEMIEVVTTDTQDFVILPTPSLRQIVHAKLAGGPHRRALPSEGRCSLEIKHVVTKASAIVGVIQVTSGQRNFYDRYARDVPNTGEKCSSGGAKSAAKWGFFLSFQSFLGALLILFFKKLPPPSSTSAYNFQSGIHSYLRWQSKPQFFSESDSRVYKNHVIRQRSRSHLIFYKPGCYSISSFTRKIRYLGYQVIAK